MFRFLIRPLLLMAVTMFPLLGNSFEGYESFEKEKSTFKVLVFLSKSCPCSRSHVAHLNDLTKRFKSVSFHGVITDQFTEENNRGIDEYYAQKNFQFPLIKDESHFLIKKYGALKTPHTVILKKPSKGVYKKIYGGGVTDKRDFSKSDKKFLSENLAALVVGQPLKYAEGKSLGCYIRRL